MRHAPLLVADPLADRQRIEEFVGDQQQRAARGRSSMRSCNIALGHALPPGPRAAPGWSRRDAPRRRTRRGASPAAHRRRASRAPAQARHRSASAGDPRAAQQSASAAPTSLAEHLADLGRGGEIARRAQADRGSHNNARCRRPYKSSTLIGPSLRDALAQARRRSCVRRRSPCPAIGSTRTRRLLGGQPSDRARQGSSAATATGPCAAGRCGEVGQLASGSRTNSMPKRKMP